MVSTLVNQQETVKRGVAKRPAVKRFAAPAGLTSKIALDRTSGGNTYRSKQSASSPAMQSSRPAPPDFPHKPYFVSRNDLTTFSNVLRSLSK